MAKYDWKQLEKEYILSEYKSVSSFFKDKGIKNSSYIRNNTKGWKEKKRQNTDKKMTKIIEETTKKEIKQEVDINTRHLELYNKFLDILEQSFKNPQQFIYVDMPDFDKLKKMIEILEKAQRGQRLAKGLDTNKDNQDVIERLDKLLEEQKNA